MRIRAAVVDDAEALTDLHLDVWEEAYAGLIPSAILTARRADTGARVERWRTNLTSGRFTTLVAEPTEPTEPAEPGERARRLTGFVSSGAGRDQESGAGAPGLPPLEVSALYVREETYGTGVGYALLRAAIGDAAAYLWVLDGNARAIGFYERQGFRFDGAVKREDVGVERRMVRG